MKNKITLSLFLWVMLLMSSCFHVHRTSININDDAEEFRIRARYERSQAFRIKQYLHELLQEDYDACVNHNGRIDATVTLEDNTRLYINARPGELLLDMDKEENSVASCERMREIGEDIKAILAGR
ncbi:MAG: hypothetical protein U0X40_11550 [Ferruginibacter sp.]